MYKCVYNIYIYIYYFIFYNYPSCYITNYQKLVHGFLNKGYWWFRYWKYMCIMKDKNDTLCKTSYKKIVYSLYFPYTNVYMIEFQLMTTFIMRVAYIIRLRYKSILSIQCYLWVNIIRWKRNIIKWEYIYIYIYC